MARIIDLTLSVNHSMRGVEIEPNTTISSKGWNTTLLHLYSHAGTHLDAPSHFIGHGGTIDSLALEKCIGPALVIDLTILGPRELITTEHLAPYANKIGPGARLLLKTGWSARVNEPDYRSHLPRVSLSLAQWLAEQEIALLAVEPPSVADVNDTHELTSVHKTLLGAEVVIVEGLTNLDALKRERVTFIALPLKLDGGDGSPVRAIAIEDDDLIR